MRRLAAPIGRRPGGRAGNSRSATRWAVVLVDRSAVASTLGVLRPAPRWSNCTMRYRAGSNRRRPLGVHPEPGPPCKLTTVSPVGFPDISKYRRCPSSTASMPVSYGSIGVNNPNTVKASQSRTQTANFRSQTSPERLRLPRHYRRWGHLDRGICGHSGLRLWARAGFPVTADAAPAPDSRQ